MDILRLFDDPIRVLLPAHHHLAAQKIVRLHDLRNETWIQPHDGPIARHIERLLTGHDLHPAIVTAGHGEEPIEAQALVAAGRGITVAHDLNVIINPDQVVARPLDGCPTVRHVQAASISGAHNPGTIATLKALRDIGQQRHGRHRRAAPATAAHPGRPDRIPPPKPPPNPRRPSG